MWKGYPCEVCAGKDSRKGRELPTALAVLGARWTRLWGQWPVRLRNLRRSVHILCVDLGCLADGHPAALASSLRGHLCCQHLDTDIQYTTSGGHVCCWSPHAILNPCSCTSLCPVAGEKDNCSSILTGLGFFLNRALK